MGCFSKLYIGSTEVSSNVWMAPMVGYTHYPFRTLVKQLGAGLAFTEMIHAGMLLSQDKTMLQRLSPEIPERDKAVQLVGSDPALMEQVCRSDFMHNVRIIDINMACPNLAVLNHGGGCALTEDLTRAGKIIEGCKRSGKTITVKCRAGMRKEKIMAEPFARMCEQAGADAIIIHGRTCDMDYSCPSVPEYIALAKAAVSIPVIANGDIASREDAEDLICQTGADGVMLGRSALKNPFLFSDITGITPDKKEVFTQQAMLISAGEETQQELRYLQNLLTLCLPEENRTNAQIQRIRDIWQPEQLMILAAQLV